MRPSDLRQKTGAHKPSAQDWYAFNMALSICIEATPPNMTSVLSKLLHNIAKRGMTHHGAEEALDHGPILHGDDEYASDLIADCSVLQVNEEVPLRMLYSRTLRGIVYDPNREFR